MAMLEITPSDESSSIKIKVGPTSPIILDESAYSKDEDEKQKPRKRTKKVGNEEIVTPDDDLPLTQTNVPYKDTFAETDNILRSVVGQIDQANYELSEDLKDIRSSKTLRNKYTYISNLESSRSSLLGSKIAAVREMNSSIKTCHDLELKRTKELKLDAGQQDDAKSIQDMYNAFVTMPVSQSMTGGFINPLGPTTMDFTTSNPNMIGFSMNQPDPEIGFRDYLNNMSPEQLTMVIEENPHINHVVRYDPVTGNADFAVYNSDTNSFIEGVPTRSAEMYMPSMQFDFDHGIAHSNDLNESYDIIMTNNVNNGPTMVSPKNDMSNY